MSKLASYWVGTVKGCGIMATGPYRAPVVNDEPAASALIGDELRRQGYDCTVATKSKQAIAPLDGDAFDLILPDISMPRLNCLDVPVCAKRKAPDLEKRKADE